MSKSKTEALATKDKNYVKQARIHAPAFPLALLYSAVSFSCLFYARMTRTDYFVVIILY